MKRTLLILVALIACLALVAPVVVANPHAGPPGYYVKIHGGKQVGRAQYFGNGHPTGNSEWQFLGTERPRKQFAGVADTATAEANVAGEGYNGHGTAFGGGGYEGGSEASSGIAGFVYGYNPRADAYANAYANGHATGGGFALNNVPVRKYLFFGPVVGSAAFGLSYGHSEMDSSADAYTTYDGKFFLGGSLAIASVEGHAWQQNGLDIYAEFGPVGGFYAGGGNLTGGIYSGTDLSLGLFSGSGANVYGNAQADGFTEGSGYTTGDYTTVQIATFGSSSAYQNGCGDTNAYGSGGVTHDAAAFSAGNNGYAYAGTSGNANFGYSVNGGNYASGSGGASTTGTSSASSNNGSVSSSAESHSHSYSGSSGGHGGGPQ